MLISISGMVGSGKTTTANRLLDAMRAAGHDAVCLRFQTLPCFAFLRSPVGRVRQPAAPQETRATGTPKPRWTGYRRKQLTAVVTLAYLARIVAFRIYRLSWRKDRSYVLNRYFYDLFVHYHLDTPRGRLYYAVLRRLLPVPDVSLLAVAAPDTIARRRPQYSREYLLAVGEAYTQLRERFPEMMELRTDTDETTVDQLGRIVAEAVARGTTAGVGGRR